MWNPRADQARAQLAEASQRISRDPAAEAQREHSRLTGMGFSEADATSIVAAIQRTPRGALKFASAFELQVGDAESKNPLVQSVWMFIADLLAASVPVLPFAFLSLAQARVVSFAVTTVLLLLLGLGRGVLGKRTVLLTMFETLLIAAAAAGAGLLIGQASPVGWAERNLTGLNHLRQRRRRCPGRTHRQVQLLIRNPGDLACVVWPLAKMGGPWQAAADHGRPALSGLALDRQTE